MKDAVVYRDERYTLGQENDVPFLIAAGEKYTLTCHPYEPCLYITDRDGFKTAVHNSFEPVGVLEIFSRGDMISSITGREYTARDFCEMVENASKKGDIGIDEAEKSLPVHPRKKPPKDEKREAEKAARYPDDPFYAFIGNYPDTAVDYCLVKNELPYCGYQSHFVALAYACHKLFAVDGEAQWYYDIGKANAEIINAVELFANAGKELNYRRAFLSPPYGTDYTDEDFDAVNGVLFPDGEDSLEVYKWTTDWSDYFDDGHEWWGTLCLTVYDRGLDRFVVILASATD